MSYSVKRRVKIVCTLGPSTRTPERLAQLIDAGMDIARQNFSHGTHDFHRTMVKNVRDAAVACGKMVAIMQDLQGPKLRVGKLPEEGVTIKAGDTVLLFPEGSTPKTSTTGKVLMPISAEIAEGICRDVQKGARILFDDGKILTQVISVNLPEIVVEVEVGGRLTSHKGMNLP